MSDSKFFLSLIGLSVVVLAILKCTSSNSKEDFLMHQFTTKAVREQSCGGGPSSAMPNPTIYPGLTSKMYSNASLQPTLAHRFNSSGLSGQVKYRIPSSLNLSHNPNAIGAMATENYSGCGGNGEGNKQTVTKSGVAPSSSMLPVADMNGAGMCEDGLPARTYERLMYANLKSRTLSQGDPIRGDIPCVPEDNGWFNVAARPASHLRQGAMMVMGGQGETSAQLANAIHIDSGGTSTTSSGMNLSGMFSSASGGDIAISSFAG
jgi:hypothetical protein